MFDWLRGPHATIVGFGSHWQPLIEECIGKFKGSLRGYVIVPGPEGVAGSSHCYVDADGHARAAYGDRSLYIIRPDNYIGMATLGLDSSPVVEYLQHIFPRESR
jgi:hypothetical protein